jgi:hypothetical protein
MLFLLSIIFFRLPVLYGRYVSLAKINRQETKTTGNFIYAHITDYTEYPMQSAMHELSTLSALFCLVNSISETAWREGVVSKTATAGSILLLEYCTSAGLTPLASEWWHYNDLANTRLAREAGFLGKFSSEKTFSTPPYHQP